MNTTSSASALREIRDFFLSDVRNAENECEHMKTT